MAQNSPLLVKLLASSVTSVSRAGKIIRDVMSHGSLGIIDKGVNDLQTEADRSSQRCIIASLSRQFPNVTIIGEEGLNNDSEVPSDWLVNEMDSNVLKMECPQTYSRVDPSDIVVWVDPLDGTSEYAQGFLEHVTVLVGIAIKGKAVAGIIHQPYYKTTSTSEPSTSLGRTMWGLVGVGVGGITPIAPPSGRLIIVTTKSHHDAIVQKAIDGIEADEVLRVGGAGHKVVMIMEGKASAYVFASKGSKKWDICAPEAVLTAMGGKLTDMHGSTYDYSKDAEHPNMRGVLASGIGVDHAYLVSKIPKDVKDYLA